MPVDDPGLDRRLREVLGGRFPAAEPDPAARRDLLARLRRRRAARRRVVGMAAVVVLLAAAAAYALPGHGTGSRPPATAAGGGANVAGTGTGAGPGADGGSAPGRPGSGTGTGATARVGPAPAAAPPGEGSELHHRNGRFVPTVAAMACVKVRVGRAPAACAGGFVQGTAAAAAPSAAPSGEMQAYGVANGTAATDGSRAAGGTGTAPETVSPGQLVVVTLSAVSGLAWGTPTVVQRTASGTAGSTAVAAGAGRAGHAGGTGDSGGTGRSARRGLVLRLVRARAGAPGHRASATFSATGPGEAVVRAVGRERCGKPAEGCRGTAVTWSVQVLVETT